MDRVPDSLLDAGLLSPVRAGSPVEAAVSDLAWLRGMLAAEAALARAQAALGTVPAPAAEAITRAAGADRFDLREIALGARRTANPVVGLVAALTEVLDADPDDAAEHVHRGATSQDIVDTAAMLVAAEARRLIRADLARTAAALAGLAARHRDTVLAGRTLGAHAVPTTFGLKAAGWRSLVLDADRRLAAVPLPVSVGGAAGTLAGYVEHARLAGVADDDYADRLVAAVAEETGLDAQRLPWHTLRTPVADLAAACAFTTGALGKLAVDVLSLARTEVGEVAEPAPGGSSAMPHKRNPVLATLLRGAALQVPALATGLTQCLLAEDERAAGVWHAEWHLLRECLRLTGGAAHTAVELAEGLDVRPARMRANLDLTGGRLVSERIAAVLAPRVGTAAAKSLLAKASRDAEESGRPLFEVLATTPGVDLNVTELSELGDVTGYVGVAAALVDGDLDSTTDGGRRRRRG